MTIPSAAQAALDAQSFVLGHWLEIEGLPYAYGNFLASDNWFANRAAGDRFLGIKRSLKSFPPSIGQDIDVLEGGSKAAGSVSFEIVDVDGAPTSWTNIATPVRSLGSAITTASTTLVLLGVPDIAVGSYLYIGTETVLVTARDVFGGTVTVTRGQFRSIPQAFPAGFPVGTAPWVMANRRCWYNQAVDSASQTPGTFVTSITTLDDNRVIRFSGVLRQMHLTEGDHATYTLRAESLDRELDRKVFELRSMDLWPSFAIADKDGRNGSITAPGWPGYLARLNTLYYADAGANFSNNEYVFWRIDQEIFLTQYAVSGAPGSGFRILERALFGTKAEKHDAGTRAQELAVVCAYRSDGTYYERASRFTSAPTANMPLPADHPLVLILQIVLSTGLGTNTLGGGARNYDVLPESWGLGIEVSRVDVAAIEAAALESPAIRFGGVIDTPTNVSELMRELCKFAGYYYWVAVGDKLTIRKLRPPMPDISQKGITNAKRIRGQFTGWDANWSGAVRRLVFNYGWDVVANKFRRVTIFNLDDADIYSKGLARTISFESKLVYPGGTGTPGEPPFRPFDVDQWLLERADLYMVRFGKPPPIITERVDYSYLGVEVGDLVYVTHSNIPNVDGGTRGLNAQLGEVIGKQPDEQSKTIELRILMTGYSLGSYKYLSPSLKLHAGDWTWLDPYLGVFNLTTRNDFTDPLEGHDGAITNPRSGGSEVLLWEVGQKVLKWDANFQTSVEGEVTLAADDQIEVEFPGSPSFADGDILTWAAYDSFQHSIGPLFAWSANGDNPEELGTNPDSPHKLFPS